MIRASDDGLSPLARLDAPRWYWSEGVGIDLEQCMPEHVVQGLIARCHDVVVAAGPTTSGVRPDRPASARWRLRRWQRLASGWRQRGVLADTKRPAPCGAGLFV